MEIKKFHNPASNNRKAKTKRSKIKNIRIKGVDRVTRKGHIFIYKMIDNQEKLDYVIAYGRRIEPIEYFINMLRMTK